MNVKYVKIMSCTDCEFSGHTVRGSKVTFICSNPIHKDLPVPKEEIDRKYFPITASNQPTFRMCPIPDWCKLVSDIQANTCDPDKE